MLERVDIGVPNPVSPAPREIEVNGRLSSTLAMAGPKMEISKTYYKTADYKRLKKTVTHELIHYYLLDNNIHCSHDRLFRLCARFMGLDSYGDNTWNYKHVCQCGHWMKDHIKHKYWVCPGCGKKNVLASELIKIQKIAELNSYCFPAGDISRFVVFKSLDKIDG
jgi:hypothetical protein